MAVLEYELGSNTLTVGSDVFTSLVGTDSSSQGLILVRCTEVTSAATLQVGLQTRAMSGDRNWYDLEDLMYLDGGTTPTNVSSTGLTVPITGGNFAIPVTTFGSRVRVRLKLTAGAATVATAFQQKLV